MSSSNTVLITGTSSGIGLATAVGAARAGWQTVATMRDVGRAGALMDAANEAGVAGLIRVEPLDVTDANSVAECVKKVVADYGRLDAVINNAGAGFVGTIEQTGVEAVRNVMEVNYFGVVEVTHAAMPHLREAGGRLITVTSVGGVIGQPFNEAYCAAKFAVEGFMESLAPVAATVGVRVMVIEPGAVASEFVASQQIDIPGLLGAAGPYAPALRHYIERTQGAFRSAQTSEEAAAAIVAALTAAEPPFRAQTSSWARGFTSTKLADLDGAAVQMVTASWVAERQH
ncbi:SDR family oxidoreductase [Nocardia acidivorans]|uniref:SDR family oxidoreductase n=1 Tax=Nocardia acidivorans TaxID=404580 RepID=UPI000834746A|nr:SDR family oxidoreductase [Nocardia acidivorans]